MKSSIDYIVKRRSIRKFTDQKVDNQDIHNILKAATSAPSSCDRKTWEFIVIDDENTLSKISYKLDNTEYNPQLAIVVCGNLKLSSCNKCEGITNECNDLWIQDCSAAMENILLGATALNLGSVWVGLYPFKENVNEVSKIVNLPQEIVPLAIAYIGHTDENLEPRNNYDETKIHWQSYN